VSGPWVERMVQAILMARGYRVVSVGVVPTPTVQLMVIRQHARGGIVITSSHNPVEWNGLKFIDADGLFLSPDKCTVLFAEADANPTGRCWRSYQRLGSCEECSDAAQLHIDEILALEYVHVDTVKERRFRVCLDTVNGAGGRIMKQLLERFGCTVIGLNLEESGLFAHTPEPVPGNLGDLCALVKREKADLGIAVDPDVDRCVLIDESGEPLGEEYTLAIAVELVVGRCGKRGPICKNLSTSRVIDELGAKYGCEVINTPVGEIQVAKVMVERGAVIGGEGNGGVMLPDIHIGRDAPVAAALALELLARHGGSLSSLKQSLPQWSIVKLKAPLRGSDPDAVIALLKAKWQGRALLSDSDGLRIDTPEWWVHLRKSNTEPIIRIIGEAHDEPSILKTCEEFKQQMRRKD